MKTTETKPAFRTIKFYQALLIYTNKANQEAAYLCIRNKVFLVSIARIRS